MGRAGGTAIEMAFGAEFLILIVILLLISVWREDYD